MRHQTTYAARETASAQAIAPSNATTVVAFKPVEIIQHQLSQDFPTVAALPLRTGHLAFPHQGGLAPWQLRKVHEFVEDNLARSVLIRNLARSVRLSESYFYAAFRRSVGEAPHAYITRRRVERAKALMLSTRLSLAQIALECGLADQPHLSRLFRRQVGSSPAAWRRKQTLSGTGQSDAPNGDVFSA